MIKLLSAPLYKRGAHKPFISMASRSASNVCLSVQPLRMCNGHLKSSCLSYQPRLFPFQVLQSLIQFLSIYLAPCEAIPQFKTSPHFRRKLAPIDLLRGSTIDFLRSGRHIHRLPLSCKNLFDVLTLSDLNHDSLHWVMRPCIFTRRRRRLLHLGQVLLHGPLAALFLVPHRPLPLLD